jgi:Lecithin retinol acyltransferase
MWLALRGGGLVLGVSGSERRGTSVVMSSTLTPPNPQQARYQSARGAHIYVERGVYSHHGIDCGDGTVIDFAGRGGGKNTAIIRRVTLAEFAQGAPVRTRSYGTCHSREIVVARAASMIGRSGYDLFSNNCEHFVTWCVAGEHSSAQVEAVWSTAGIVGVGNIVPRVGRNAVVGLGETAPRSASNVMSGLTKLGGSAVGGVTVVAGAGAVVGAGTMLFALRDKPYLTDQERTARRVGRVAGVGGAAVGTWAAVHSVGALGVAGYSAAGLSSGLAALGSVAGGGMVTGVAVVAAIPLLAAFAFALLAHGLMRCLKPPAPDLRAAI